MIRGGIPKLPHGQKFSEADHFEDYKVLGCYSQSKAKASQLVLDAVKHYVLAAFYRHFFLYSLGVISYFFLKALQKYPELSNPVSIATSVIVIWLVLSRCAARLNL